MTGIRGADGGIMHPVTAAKGSDSERGAAGVDLIPLYLRVT